MMRLLAVRTAGGERPHLAASRMFDAVMKLDAPSPIAFLGLAVLVIASSLQAAVAIPPAPANPPPFELQNGDRVALVGNTFIERAQQYGYFELALTMQWPNRQIVFRNLGWSGDDVTGESRLYFGSYRDTTVRQEGLDRLLDNIRMIEPTVIFVGYGSNEAFEGPPGVDAFLNGYNHLLDQLAKITPRIVLLSPIAQENLGPPLPDPAERNHDLALYGRTIESVAEKRSYRFVDLFGGLNEFREHAGPLTDNGMHLTAGGYYYCALALLKGLGIEVPNLTATPLRDPLVQEIHLTQEAEQLRQLIIEKDRLFFLRYRPPNDTYLRGFREYEQGINAGEILEYEPLVEQLDQQIHQRKLLLPKNLVYLPARARGATR